VKLKREASCIPSSLHQERRERRNPLSRLLGRGVWTFLNLLRKICKAWISSFLERGSSQVRKRRRLLPPQLKKKPGIPSGRRKDWTSLFFLQIKKKGGFCIHRGGYSGRRRVLVILLN